MYFNQCVCILSLYFRAESKHKSKEKLNNLVLDIPVLVIEWKDNVKIIQHTCTSKYVEHKYKTSMNNFQIKRLLLSVLHQKQYENDACNIFPNRPCRVELSFLAVSLLYLSGDISVWEIVHSLV